MKQTAKYLISPDNDSDLYWDFGNSTTGTELKVRYSNMAGNRFWHFIRAPTPSTDTSPQPTTSPRPPPPIVPHDPPPSNAPNDSPKVSQPDREEKKALIFSMDVGTISSVVSFLRPDDAAPVPVSNWPLSNANVRAVPSVMTFNPGGKILYGRESEPAGGPNVVAGFKRKVLQLWSADQANDIIPGHSIASVYEDWIRFLFLRAKEVFEKNKRGSDRENDWKERLLIFAIPNSWTLTEQTILRDTIVAAGCVEDKNNVRFVTESDAVLHHLIHNKGLKFEDNKEFIICDAGGSTIEVALYQVKRASPLMITQKAKAPSSTVKLDLFKAYTQYATELQGTMVKPQEGEDQEEDFGDEAGEEKEDPLQDCVDTIQTAIDQIAEGNAPKTLILMGGFFNIPRVYDDLRGHYEGKGMAVAKRAEQSAVADGALYFYRCNAVVAHAAPFGYGCSVLVSAKANKNGIEGRKVLRFPNGLFVEGGWSPIIVYGQLVQEGERSKRMFYTKTYASRYAELSKVEVDLYARGREGNPDWVFDKNGNLMKGFWTVATIQVDFSELEGKLEKVNRRNGIPFYKLEFEVEILFGSQSLQATVFWGEGGKFMKETSFAPPADASDKFKHTR
ncbi:hypothetical protein JAAARDRAFT_80474 [Jaapia argillacea MUCL 33604]|uniref:Uncharacterized protein n=1 Tax=Jaapia argillacea MUCL 33604 TaxID=933084 RepID=A0A067PRB3_9AGAM|nr:hypothetical protein JAAARDRAFT_80474 [Jaapia argillacea MUCL 33604]